MRSIRYLLLLPLLLAATACGPSFMQKASVADKLAAHETLQIRLAVDKAHTDNCAPSGQPVKPCLSDADYQVARADFDKLADAGKALGKAIRDGDQQAAKTQAKVTLQLANDLLDAGVVKLPSTIQLIVTTSLTTITTVMSGLN